LGIILTALSRVAYKSKKQKGVRISPKEVIPMKSIGCIDQINNGYALLLYGENEREQMDVRLETLAKYIPGPIREGDVLEITLSDGNEVTNARKLVSETLRREKEVKGILNWMMYRTTGGEDV
jgi:hypothetical protein